MKAQIHTAIWASALALLTACGPAQRVTSSWTDPQYRSGKAYKKVFIAALIGNQRVRGELEEHMAGAARARGLQAVKSMDIFPRTFSRETGPDKDAMMHRIREYGCDLIFTVTLVERKSEVRHVPGINPYMPFRGYGFGFRGYYGYWYPMLYDPGYYTTDRTYLMEGNLFDGETERMLWSVQTESYNPPGIDRFSEGLTEVMLERALRDLGIR